MTTDVLPDDPAFLAAMEARFLEGAVGAAVVAGTLGAPRAGRLDHATLWRHATRRPGEPVDFAAARLLRESAEARTVLSRMIGSRSIAVSPMAFAAADGSAPSRRVGDVTIDLVPAGADGVTTLVLDVGEAARVPTVLRADWAGRSVVLALPPPDEGLIELFFSAAAEEHRAIVAVLSEPTALFALE